MGMSLSHSMMKMSKKMTKGGSGSSDSYYYPMKTNSRKKMMKYWDDSDSNSYYSYPSSSSYVPAYKSKKSRSGKSQTMCRARSPTFDVESHVHSHAHNLLFPLINRIEFRKNAHGYTHPIQGRPKIGHL